MLEHPLGGRRCLSRHPHVIILKQICDRQNATILRKQSKQYDGGKLIGRLTIKKTLLYFHIIMNSSSLIIMKHHTAWLWLQTSKIE